MPLNNEIEDAVILAAVNSIGAMLQATVVAVVLADADGRPFMLPHPDVSLEDIRVVFRALGNGRWNASKSL